MPRSGGSSTRIPQVVSWCFWTLVWMTVLIGAAIMLSATSVVKPPESQQKTAPFDEAVVRPRGVRAVQHRGSYVFLTSVRKVAKSIIAESAVWERKHAQNENFHLLVGHKTRTLSFSATPSLSPTNTSMYTVTNTTSMSLNFSHSPTFSRALLPPLYPWPVTMLPRYVYYTKDVLQSAWVCTVPMYLYNLSQWNDTEFSTMLFGLLGRKYLTDSLTQPAYTDGSRVFHATTCLVDQVALRHNDFGFGMCNDPIPCTVEYATQRKCSVNGVMGCVCPPGPKYPPGQPVAANITAVYAIPPNCSYLLTDDNTLINLNGTYWNGMGFSKVSVDNTLTLAINDSSTTGIFFNGTNCTDGNYTYYNGTYFYNGTTGNCSRNCSYFGNCTVPPITPPKNNSSNTTWVLYVASHNCTIAKNGSLYFTGFEDMAAYLALLRYVTPAPASASRQKRRMHALALFSTIQVEFVLRLENAKNWRATNLSQITQEYQSLKNLTYWALRQTNMLGRWWIDTANIRFRRVFNPRTATPSPTPSQNSKSLRVTVSPSLSSDVTASESRSPKNRTRRNHTSASFSVSLTSDITASKSRSLRPKTPVPKPKKKPNLYWLLILLVIPVAGIAYLGYRLYKYIQWRAYCNQYHVASEEGNIQEIANCMGKPTWTSEVGASAAGDGEKGPDFTEPLEVNMEIIHLENPIAKEFGPKGKDEQEGEDGTGKHDAPAGNPLVYPGPPSAASKISGHAIEADAAQEGGSDVDKLILDVVQQPVTLTEKQAAVLKDVLYSPVVAGGTDGTAAGARTIPAPTSDAVKTDDIIADVEENPEEETAGEEDVELEEEPRDEAATDSNADQDALLPTDNGGAEAPQSEEEIR